MIKTEHFPGSSVKQCKYSFYELSGKRCPSLESNDIQQKLMKWSMKGRLKVKSFTFDEQFKSYYHKEFIEDMFRSDVVTASLGIIIPKDQQFSCIIQEINCTATTMSIFKPLVERFTRSNGAIRKCLDYNLEGIFISDEIRKCILDEDSDEYGLVPPELRKEFIFKLFGHICIGGELCQSEDNINEYFEFLRPVYRDLISVYKNPESHEIEVASRVYGVSIQVMERDFINILFQFGDKED